MSEEMMKGEDEKQKTDRQRDRETKTENDHEQKKKKRTNERTYECNESTNKSERLNKTKLHIPCGKNLSSGLVQRQRTCNQIQSA
jgi:hypothetical protein